MSASTMFFTQDFARGLPNGTAQMMSMIADYEGRKDRRRPPRPATTEQARRFRWASETRLGPEKKVWNERCSTGKHRTGKCLKCGQGGIVAKYEYTCGLGLCPKCWIGRLFADWKASRVAEVLPLDCGFHETRSQNPGSLAQVRTRAKEWRERHAIKGGVEGYGCERTGPGEFRWYVTLITDAGEDISSTRSFNVASTFGKRGKAWDWFSSHYRRMLDLWRTPEELEYLVQQTKGKRRFQSFGNLYAATPPPTAEGQNDTAVREGVRVPATHHGGDGKYALRHRKDVCPYCHAINTIKWDGPLVEPEESQYGKRDALGTVRRKR
jgi:RNA polymerase subunit RPABC4/transcription elongation factor Spt4